jgi:hypothetical protein
MVRWYFAPNKPDSRWWRVVAWWELRRIPYNMLVGAWGFGSLVIYYLALKGSGELKPGDDAVEPMALMVAPFVINAGYTLGWFVELALRALLPLQVNKSTLGPALMKAGCCVFTPRCDPSCGDLGDDLVGERTARRTIDAGPGLLTPTPRCARLARDERAQQAGRGRRGAVLGWHAHPASSAPGAQLVGSGRGGNGDAC